MEKEMKLEERLIVAADFEPKRWGSIGGVHYKVMELAQSLKGLGVYIKVNSILRAVGYGLIRELHDHGLKVFADLKLIDIPNTMATDAEFLREVKPEMVTVMCSAGIEGMSMVQAGLPDSKVLGVTVLTSLNEEDCQAIFTCSTKAGVLRFARMAKLAGLGELILSPKEIEIVKNRFELRMQLNTPGIRPAWASISGDDQSRTLTPLLAIKNGATRIVIGRPITQARPNSDGLPQSPREAVEITLKEIQTGLEQRDDI